MRDQLPLKTSGARGDPPRALAVWPAFLVCVLPLVVSKHASADAKSCAGAYEDGQRLRGAGQLVEAASKFLYCAGPQCPELMHDDCQRRLDETEAAVPSVVVRVDSSVELQAEFALDGGEGKAIDGQAVRLNPGRHELRVSAPGYQPLSHHFIVSEGEKLRALDVALEPVAEPRRDAPPRPAPARSGAVVAAPGRAHASPARWVPWAITSGVVAAGSAGLIYWGLRARQGELDLRVCTPECSWQQVRDVKRDYLLANVSLGVGLSGLAAMAVWYFVEASDAGPPRASGSRSATLAVAFPLGSSAALTVPF